MNHTGVVLNQTEELLTDMMIRLLNNLIHLTESLLKLKDNLVEAKLGKTLVAVINFVG